MRRLLNMVWIVATLLTASLLPACQGARPAIAPIDLNVVAERGTVDSAGLRLVYQIDGQGLPVVVIGASAAIERALSAQLRDDFQFVFADLQLSSESTLPAGGIAPEQISQAVELLRRKLGVEQWFAMGHAAAGLLALDYARRYPQRVVGVVMVGTPPLMTAAGQRASREAWLAQASPERKEALDQNLAKLEAGEFPPEEAFVRQQVAAVPLGWYDFHADVAYLWEGVQPDPILVNHLLTVTFNDYDPTAAFPQVETPVYIAVGRYDFLAPLSLWEQYSRALPQATLQVYEQSGRYPMVEEQAAFDKSLVAWARDLRR